MTSQYSIDEIKSLRAIPIDFILNRYLIYKHGHWTSQEGGIFITINNNLFYDHYSKKGGKGAIDLVIQLFNYNFLEAVEYLNQIYFLKANYKLPNKTTEFERKKTILESKKINVKQRISFVEKPENWYKIRNYLVKTRKLNIFIVEKLHNEGLISSDNYSNCMFFLRNWEKKSSINGFALKGISSKPFHYIKGKKNKNWFYFGEHTEHIYITESPIDAISLYQILRNFTKQSKGVYIATCGIGDLPKFDSHAKIHIATDLDIAGELFAWRIAKQYPYQTVRHAPLIGKDFNDCLQDKEDKINSWWKSRMGKEWSKLLQHPENTEFAANKNIKYLQKLFSDIKAS